MTDYRLEDLYSFFGESSLNENLVFDNGTKIITLNQVNQAFPIECLRTGGDNFYTIYKVLEGGFFYVFWSEALTNNIDENNVYVYFSTYINSFPSLEPVMLNGTFPGERTIHPHLSLRRQWQHRFHQLQRSKVCVPKEPAGGRHRYSGYRWRSSSAVYL